MGLTRSCSNWAADKATGRVYCARCRRGGRMPVLFTQPWGWKRIADSLGRAVYICERCR